MDVRINGRDIYCSLKNNDPDYDSVYHTLKEVMKGEDFIFTQRNAGVNYLQWNLPQGQWKALDTADDIIFSMVIAYISDVKKKYLRVLAGKGLEEHHIESIFTVPDNRFIYYIQEQNAVVAVKLTAWGYKYPQKITSRGVVIGVPTAPPKQPVFVKFIYDGEFLLNYAYDLILKDGSPKRLSTDDNGVSYIADITVGDYYEIKDVVSGNVYTLNVEKDKEVYVFDVTRYATIQIHTLEDDKAKSGICCEIEYLGNKQVQYTQDNGKVEIKVPYHLNEKCVVNAMQMTQCKELNYPTTALTFEIHTQRPETPPVLTAPRIHVIDNEGNVIPAYPIESLINGIRSQHISDEQGIIQLGEYPIGTTIQLVDGNNSLNVQSVTTDIAKRRYDFIVSVIRETPQPVADISIKVEDYNNQLITEGLLRLHQKGCDDICKQLDAQGEICIPADYFKSSMPIGVTLIATGRDFSPALMYLADREKEYVIKIERQERRWLNWLITIPLFLIATSLLCIMILWLIKVMY